MKNKLTELCCSNKVPVREVKREDWDLYGTQTFDEDYLVKSMAEIDGFLDGNVIVMGGFCACSKILGYRPMRRASNDLDCITNEEGFYLLNKHFNGQIFQNSAFGDLFLEYNKIPVGFDIGETHDWEIPKEFIDDAKTFNFSCGKITSISPEFLIALKARRSILKKRFYGKDALDTANMVLAPIYRTDLSQIDLSKLSSLFREHSTDSFDDLDEYLKFVSSHSRDLKIKEKPLFEERMSSIQDCAKKVYAKSY
ncbi:MAG: nucleotidyltransferase [Candidatus Pacearchaeota archaeon]|jgi:hypothetical protein